MTYQLPFGATRRGLIKGAGAAALSAMVAPALAKTSAPGAILNGAAAQLPPGQPISRSGSFTWTNPIRDGIPGGIRDAQIFYADGAWRLMGGMPPFWDGAAPGVRLLSSDDLLTWRDPVMLLERDKIPEQAWYRDRFWAPEIHTIGGLWFLLVNCRNESEDYPAPHGGLVAVSEKFDGPYKVLTTEESFMSGNDLTFFEDDDGQTYAFWNSRKVMQGCRIHTGPDHVWRLGQFWDCFYIGGPKEWDMIGIEGPYVIKRDGIYYMFYSSWSRGYEIGYATATRLQGPWTKHPGNPIYGAQSRGVCEKNGLEYTGDPDQPFRAVGHNEVFTGPDGRLWISCHGIMKGDAADYKKETPGLVIDPIDFVDGEIRIAGPSYRERTVTW